MNAGWQLSCQGKSAGSLKMGASTHTVKFRVAAGSVVTCEPPDDVRNDWGVSGLPVDFGQLLSGKCAPTSCVSWPRQLPSP
jgi:hypothetical protein